MKCRLHWTIGKLFYSSLHESLKCHQTLILFAFFYVRNNFKKGFIWKLRIWSTHWLNKILLSFIKTALWNVKSFKQQFTRSTKKNECLTWIQFSGKIVQTKKTCEILKKSAKGPYFSGRVCVQVSKFGYNRWLCL